MRHDSDAPSIIARSQHRFYVQVRRGRVILPLLLTLLFALLITGFRPATDVWHQAPQDLYDVRVNQATTADQHEPTLAVDPTNPNNLLAAAKDWRTGPKQVWYYRSTDAGRTWADGHLDIAGELQNQSDPVIAFDATGASYLTVIGYNQNDLTVGGIFVARTRDLGRTWDKPVLVSANSDKLFNDKQWLTVDRSNNPSTKGNIYLSWTLFTTISPNRERGDIVVSRSTDGGKTFSPYNVVSLPSQADNQGSYPAIGPNGEVYVLYYSDRLTEANEGNALYVAKSTDGGKTFPQVRKAASIARPRSPLPGSQFRIFVLPALAIDPKSGAVYATWNDYGAGNSDTMLVRSTDGGLTWNTPIRVNDDAASSNRDQFFSTVTVGSDGTVHLLWLDRRDDPANKLYAPYYARSTDGGSTFTRNAPASSTRSNPGVGFEGVLIGDYIALDVSADASRVYAAWVDTRNGDQDIYFSTFGAQSGPGVTAAPAAATLPPAIAVPSPQPLTGFTDEAFRLTWERTDRPVLQGRASRPWTWGPVSFAAALEAYSQGQNGTREVQYFDKTRMEINNPGGDRNSAFFVTNGLLVVELVSGRVQTGNEQFESPRPPAQVPVAGDLNSPDALTYASLAPVASLNGDKRAADRTGQGITAVLDRAGQVREDPTRAGTIKLVRYEANIGHNIPDVFWSFMNATGPVYNSRLQSYSDAQLLNWERDLGYPITEPYWTNVRIGGTSKWVLVQAFQRRVLTYVADNPPGWQVEMGNVGRHYYDWRYGQAARR
jgi:BNR repeat protein